MHGEHEFIQYEKDKSWKTNFQEKFSFAENIKDEKSTSVRTKI